MWVELSIGVLSSIFATVVWYMLSQTWKIEDRKIIARELETAITCLHVIEAKIGYPEDYDRILLQTDRMYDSLNKAVDTIKLFTYRLDFDRKKMIITIIWDNIRLCERSKNTTIGYSGKEERIERSNNIRQLLEKKNNIDTDLLANLTALYIAKDLNNDKNFKDSALFWITDEQDLKYIKCRILDLPLIDNNSFKQGNEIKRETRYNCFTKKQYMDYLEKQLK